MYLLFARRLPATGSAAGAAEVETGWLNDDEVGSSMSERYVDALYVSLLIVVGEDSYPSTSWQRAFVVVAMIAGACFYATVVGSVGKLTAIKKAAIALCFLIPLL